VVLCACAKPVAANTLANNKPFMRGAKPRPPQAPNAIASCVIFPLRTANTPVVSIRGFNRCIVTVTLHRLACKCFFFTTNDERRLDRHSYIMEREAVQKGFMGASGAAGEAEMVAGCGC
jgi:hypothetical protein